jgi:hypothetical protein
MCTADDITDHSNTFCHRVVLHQRKDKSVTVKRTEKSW